MVKKFPKDDMLELEEGDAPDGYELIDEGDWSVDIKYQHREIIFGHEGKCYRLISTRSGSPFTDYTYDSELWPDDVECNEVECVEKTVISWRAVA